MLTMDWTQTVSKRSRSAHRENYKMKKSNYSFPVSTLTLLRSYRQHMTELAESTDFLSPSHGYQRLAHFSVLDDLLIHLFIQEHGRMPSSDERDRINPRPEELGPAHCPNLDLDGT